MTEAILFNGKEVAEKTGPETTRGGIQFSPRVDIRENVEEVVLLCDVPGVRPQDFDIRFEKEELSLYGKVQPRQMPADYLMREYEVGDFRRTFAIGPEVDGSKIAAEYRDGVLTIHLPKQEKAKPQRIAVKTA